MKEYFRIDEVAEELQVSKRTVYRLIQDGLLPAFPIRPGGALRIPQASFKRYVRDQILIYQDEMGILSEETVPADDNE